MSPARHNPYDGDPLDTLLAQVRLSRGVMQEELAGAVGVSAQTIRRLERGELENPKLRTLVNCAIALGVELADVLEDDWLGWLPTGKARRPRGRTSSAADRTVPRSGRRPRLQGSR